MFESVTIFRFSHTVMAPEELRAIGEEVYGRGWKAAMGRDLGLGDPYRLMYCYDEGISRIPSHVAHGARVLLALHRRGILDEVQEDAREIA